MTDFWTIQRSHVLRRLLLWLMSVSLAGCIQPVAYKPNPTLLQQLSRDEATDELQRVMLRAISPQVDEIRVTPDVLHYRLSLFPGAGRLYFGKIQRLEVFVNHTVLVRAYGNVVLAKMVFPTADDAVLFADLLLSFRDMYLAQSRYPLPRTY